MERTYSAFTLIAVLLLQFYLLAGDATMPHKAPYYASGFHIPHSIGLPAAGARICALLLFFFCLTVYEVLNLPN
jgi:hypothetical protein